MTTMTDPPQGAFRLSMLINDTRYRSYTFQFIALIVLIAALAYLMSNLFANLAAAGLNISYRFLNEPAGYDVRSEEHTSELQSLTNLVCRLLLEKKKHAITLSNFSLFLRFFVLSINSHLRMTNLLS